jgi:predicted glycoside hydrolase/deacetylase ChbG (UPF0249 family)
VEVEAEFRAQYRRFVDLTGGPPANVNAHHHVHVFRPVGDALVRVLKGAGVRPFVRRITGQPGLLRTVPGARVKRAVLGYFGTRSARRMAAAGLPGNEMMLGITDPPCVRDPAFFARWLAAAPGRFVELSCHPGHLDLTLEGRDGARADGHIDRRPEEFARLSDPGFLDAARRAGFELVTAAELARRQETGDRRPGAKNRGRERAGPCARV